MRRYSTFLYLLLFVAGCKNKWDQPPLNNFKVQKTLAPVELTGDFTINYPGQMEMMDSVLFVVDYYTGRNLIRAYDVKNSRELKSFCHKGLDTTDFLPPILIQANYKDSCINVYGKKDKVLGKYPLSDILSGKKSNPNEMQMKEGRVSDCIQVGDSFICNGLFTNNKRLGILNKLTSFGNDVKTRLDYPVSANGLNDEEKFLSYQQYLIANKEGDRLVSATTFTDNISFLKKDPDGLTVLKTYQSHDPVFKYVTIGSLKLFRPWKKNIMGFLDLKGSEKHVFALYCGEVVEENKFSHAGSETILVYDWAGNPRCLLKTGKKISMFVVDEDEKYLIGLSYEPQPVLYKFSLKGIL